MKKDGAAGLRKMDDRFGVASTVEDQFKMATVGLVSPEEYAAQRAELEALAELKNAVVADVTKKKKEEVTKKKSVLSFDADEEDGEDSGPGSILCTILAVDSNAVLTNF
jgi:hypothetical protein